jgi:uncharacterized RDD family membrane protein YckC
VSAAAGAPRASARPAGPPLAPLGRRLLSLVYEALLLAALLWCASLLFWAIERELAPVHVRTVLQIYLAFVMGTYFVWQWTHRGQTLPMKTWRLKLVKRDGTPVDTRTAVLRYLAAMIGAFTFGFGFLWAIVDRERQFLHDRLTGTRIVRV